MTSDFFGRLDALLSIALRLAATAPSGRLALARLYRSIDPEWIPRPWGDDIAAQLAAAAQSALDPLDRRASERLLRDAWGGKPTDELDSFDPDPVRVMPGAQVHRGVLDGSPVAITLLRPGLAATVRQDLALLDGLAAPLGAAFPALDARAILREVRERVLEELDLEHAAGLQRRFHRALRGHPYLFVPAPFTALARENVLVAEWVDGVPIAAAPDPDRSTARLLAFVVGAARFGQAIADPSLDETLVLPDGRVAILNFASSAPVDAGRLADTAAAVEAFAAGDDDGFAAAVGRLGSVPPELAPDALALIRESLGDLAVPGVSRLDSGAVIAARDRALRHPALADVLLGGQMVPSEIWPARGVAQLFGVIARVGASGDWLALVRSALAHGWDAPDL